MNTENIRNNYMVLEQLLRLTGFYKQLCCEYDFFKIIFKEARKGAIDHLFDSSTQETVMNLISDFTGVSQRFWNGESALHLNIIYKAPTNLDKCKDPNSTFLNNPLNLDITGIYEAITDDLSDTESTYRGLSSIKKLYSLRGLLTVILLNAKGSFDMRYNPYIYYHKKWESFMKVNKITKHGISYCPKYLEIRPGKIQIIINNLYRSFTYYGYLAK